MWRLGLEALIVEGICFKKGQKMRSHLARASCDKTKYSYMQLDIIALIN